MTEHTRTIVPSRTLKIAVPPTELPEARTVPLDKTRPAIGC